VPFDDVAAYYAQIDLFVVPRIDERAARMVSPMKPFEAMAMRIPNLVADLPALVEISGGGTRAGLFKAGDPSSLASEARRLLDSPETLAAMADAADTWVRAERSWEASAAGFADAYDAVLSGRA
jgi:glycosyltransferase involved in cell wall biosynthesis